MADGWYYVQKGNRHGPVELEQVLTMVRATSIGPDDYVWKKGFENWRKVREVPEVFDAAQASSSVTNEEAPVAEETVIEGLSGLDPEAHMVWIRIGKDRGLPPVEYGPYSVTMICQLFEENRINGKTEVFTKGMKEWIFLADLPDYAQLFSSEPPVIPPAERRTTVRRPFIARMFIQNNKKVYEGICRDISIGGMQVLVDEFPGKAGDKISINVHPENSDYHFVASGVIVRLLEGDSGFSFRFMSLSAEAREAIEKYIANADSAH